MDLDGESAVDLAFVRLARAVDAGTMPVPHQAEQFVKLMTTMIMGIARDQWKESLSIKRGGSVTQPGRRQRRGPSSRGQIEPASHPRRPR